MARRRGRRHGVTIDALAPAVAGARGSRRARRRSRIILDHGPPARQPVRLIDVEDLSDKELEHVKAFYVRLAARSKREQDIHESHSLDEASTRRKPRLPDDQQ